jgi:ABC-2 type transport system permease protein
MLARFLMACVQMVLLFVYGNLVFGLSLGTSVLAFGAMTAAIVFSMTGFGLLVSSFADTREQIIPLGLTVVMVVCALGGCWWPLFQAPIWLQEVARISLAAWAMDGLHDLILRERGLLDIAPTLGVLVGYGAVCTGLGMHRQTRRQRRL